LRNQKLREGSQRVNRLQPHAPQQDQRGEFRAVQLEEAVNDQHHGDIVSLSLRFVLLQVAQGAEFAPVVSRLPEHVIEADDVPEAQVDALTRERVDSVGGVPKNSSAVWEISIEKIHNSP
jgi:hypothetical protein